MTRIAYVNGAYVNHADAATHIEDRGYQFADGIYEYFAFYNRVILDEAAHLSRLEASLQKLSIPAPMSMRALHVVIHELIERNRRLDGGLYLQITRGVARRDHAFPANTRPVLSMTICAPKTPKPQEFIDGTRVITHPDQRWARCDIKSISLLASILAKQASATAKAREAWLLLPDGTVTEGAASNAFIITKTGEILTHPADHRILPGITRDIVLKIAREQGMKVTEKPFTITEAKQAAEAFLTSTSPNVLPVTRIDGDAVGSGKPGEITKKLIALYHAHVFNQTGKQL